MVGFAAVSDQLRLTGTPGMTQAMKPGDTFEVEVVCVATLKDNVAAAKHALCATIAHAHVD